MEDPTSWGQILTQVGSGGAIMLMIIAGLWKSAQWLGENVARPLVASHTALIEQLRVSDGEKTELLKALADGQRSIADNSSRTDQEILKTQQEMLSLMKGMQNACQRV